MQEIEKPDYNEEVRVVEFRRPDGAGQLDSEETIASCSVVCRERVSGKDVSSDMISDVDVYNQTCVKYTLKGGQADLLYIVSVRLVSSDARKLAEKFLLRVI